MSRLSARKSDRVGRNGLRANRRGDAKRKQGKSQAAKKLVEFTTNSSFALAFVGNSLYRTDD